MRRSETKKKKKIEAIGGGLGKGTLNGNYDIIIEVLANEKQLTTKMLKDAVIEFVKREHEQDRVTKDGKSLGNPSVTEVMTATQVKKVKAELQHQQQQQQQPQKCQKRDSGTTGTNGTSGAGGTTGTPGCKETVDSPEEHMHTEDGNKSCKSCCHSKGLSLSKRQKSGSNHELSDGDPVDSPNNYVRNTFIDVSGPPPPGALARIPTDSVMVTKKLRAKYEAQEVVFQ